MLRFFLAILCASVAAPAAAGDYGQNPSMNAPLQFAGPPIEHAAPLIPPIGGELLGTWYATCAYRVSTTRFDGPLGIPVARHTTAVQMRSAPTEKEAASLLKDAMGDHACDLSQFYIGTNRDAAEAAFTGRRPANCPVLGSGSLC